MARASPATPMATPAALEKCLETDRQGIERPRVGVGGGRPQPVRGQWSQPTACSAWTAMSRRCASSPRRAAGMTHGSWSTMRMALACWAQAGGARSKLPVLQPRDVPVLMCTLGKAFGDFGAFVAGSETLIETLIQRGRSYIYTTALPPALAAAARAALAVDARGRLAARTRTCPRRAVPGGRDCARLRAFGVRHADPAARYRRAKLPRSPRAKRCSPIGCGYPRSGRRPYHPGVRACVSRSRLRTTMTTSNG